MVEALVPHLYVQKRMNKMELYVMKNVMKDIMVLVQFVGNIVHQLNQSHVMLVVQKRKKFVNVKL
jgi:hypothetical protein